ncbi:MAG: FAD:protein FMN transferase, partial [Gallionellaceae bacterium]|nr:FAD:protein FMN transferase [Gallionellaceae bacterium]
MKSKTVTTETQRYREKSEKNLCSKIAAFLGISLSLWLTLFLSACHREPPTYEEQGYVFGTLVEISVYGESEARAKEASAAVMAEFQRLHVMLHAWDGKSPFAELNGLNMMLESGDDWEISQELAAILKDATQLSEQSGGLFNPAIGKLIKLWGFQSDEFKAVLPDEAEIKRLVDKNPQMSDLTFTPAPDGQHQIVRGCLIQTSELGFELPPSKRPYRRKCDVQIDLGGYAKGYALDRAADILKKMGVKNALINIGGNVMALGAHGDRPWRIGIQHPRKPGPIATMELRDGEAIGTSGDYQRYFELNGKRYCHLIDPRTGWPVQGVQAVTILTHGARAGVLSDAPSKPLFISGLAGWREAARRMNIEDALLID